MVWTFREAPFALAGSRILDGQARSEVRYTDSYCVVFRNVLHKTDINVGPKRVFSVYITHLAASVV